MLFDKASYTQEMASYPRYIDNNFLIETNSPLFVCTKEYPQRINSFDSNEPQILTNKHLLDQLFEIVEKIDNCAQYEIFSDELKYLLCKADKIKKNPLKYNSEQINYYKQRLYQKLIDFVN